MKRPRSVHNGIRDQPLVKRGELPTMCPGQGQEIAVCHLCGIQEATAIHTFCIQERDVIGPEIVAGQRTQPCQ